MRKILLITIFVASYSLAYCQQTATNAVKKTINTMFDAMRKGYQPIKKGNQYYQPKRQMDLSTL
jgi:hypothetical protein